MDVRMMDGHAASLTIMSLLRVCVCVCVPRVCMCVSPSALGPRYPLREAAVGLEHLVRAALPGDAVPAPAERLPVQLPALQPAGQEPALRAHQER